MPDQPVLAAVYCRLSQDRAGAGVVVERQERECRDLADRLGWQVVMVHVDNDVSAYSGKSRPGYLALLEAVRAGRVGAVLAWHTDRLHRSPRELEDWITACERANVVTHTVRSGPVDLSTPSGRAVARTLGAWARHESEHLSARTLAGKRDAATRGAWNGGPRVYGYRYPSPADEPGPPLLPVPGEARAIRDAAAHLLAGGSLRAAARALNEQGALTTRGAAWTGSALRKVLLRPTTAGLRTDPGTGQVIGAGGWEPLLDEPTWRQVGLLLTDPARRTAVSFERRWLLSGIALCGVCGGQLIAHTKAGGGPGNRRPAYRCRARAVHGSAVSGVHVIRGAASLDGHVVEFVLALLARPDAADLLAPPAPDLAPLHAEHADVRGRLEQAAGLFADGVLTAEQLATATGRLRPRLDQVAARLAAAAPADVLSGLVGAPDLLAAWQALPLERRRLVVDALVTVTVLPRAHSGRLPGGGYYDRSAVRIEPRRA